MDAHAIVRRSDRAAFRAMAGDSGGVVLHLDTSAYHGVNATGALIWELIGDGVTFVDLVARLRERLPEAPPELEQDTAEFLRELSARDLVAIEGNSEALDP